MGRIPRAIAASLAVASVLAIAAGAAHGACKQWSSRTLLSGQGWLENLAFDPHRGLFVSALQQGKVLRVSPSGGVRTLIKGVQFPGGLSVRGRSLFFNTGDGATSTPGTIGRYRFKSRKRTTWARGLTNPNGLMFLPNGDAAVSRDTGTGTGITRVRANDRAHPQLNWAPIDGTNGLAVDPSGRWLYATDTFKSLVYRIKISDPTRIKTIATLPPPTLPDDMTIDAKGRLYIAAFGPGAVLRLNPATGASCSIASNLGHPTSVRFGAGPGWSRRSIYLTNNDGTLRRLTPPR